MIVGDEIKAIMLSLEGKVLTHSAEIVAYMKLSGRLYARKYSQVSLLISEDGKTAPVSVFVRRHEGKRPLRQ